MNNIFNNSNNYNLVRDQIIQLSQTQDTSLDRVDMITNIVIDNIDSIRQSQDGELKTSLSLLGRCFEKIDANFSNFLNEVAKQITPRPPKKRLASEINTSSKSKKNKLENVKPSKKIKLDQSEIDRFFNAIESHTCITAFLKDGIDVHAKTSEGLSPLHFALLHSNEGVISKLCEYGADVHARTPKGWTPLHFAAAYNATDAISELCRFRADPNATTANGLTPLQLAAGNDALEALSELCRWGAELFEEGDKTHLKNIVGKSQVVALEVFRLAGVYYFQDEIA